VCVCSLSCEALAARDLGAGANPAAVIGAHVLASLGSTAVVGLMLVAAGIRATAIQYKGATGATAPLKLLRL
jgi:hypothetical protein